MKSISEHGLVYCRHSHSGWIPMQTSREYTRQCNAYACRTAFATSCSRSVRRCTGWWLSLPAQYLGPRRAHTECPRFAGFAQCVGWLAGCALNACACAIGAQSLAGVMDGSRNYTAKIEYLVKATALSNNGYLHVETAHMRRYSCSGCIVGSE
jgi:hypothetical protein